MRTGEANREILKSTSGLHGCPHRQTHLHMHACTPTSRDSLVLVRIPRIHSYHVEPGDSLAKLPLFFSIFAEGQVSHLGRNTTVCFSQFCLNLQIPTHEPEQDTLQAAPGSYMVLWSGGQRPVQICHLGSVSWKSRLGTLGRR